VPLFRRTALVHTYDKARQATIRRIRLQSRRNGALFLPSLNTRFKFDLG